MKKILILVAITLLATACAGPTYTSVNECSPTGAARYETIDRPIGDDEVISGSVTETEWSCNKTGETHWVRS